MKCTTCDNPNPTFYKSYRNKCKECVKLRNKIRGTSEAVKLRRREKYALNPDSKKASTKRWRDKNPEKRRSTRIKWKYGLNQSQYGDILNNQDGQCAICNIDLKEHKANVDHDHSSNRIRGLLCTNCNIGLGHFKDNKESLSKAIKYLEVYENKGSTAT